MTTIRKQQTPRSYNKIVYCVNQFAFIWYFFHGCSFYCYATIILINNLEIHWFKRRRCKTANNYVLWLYLKVLRLLHTLKRASYATSPISRMELSTCSVSSQHNRQQNRSHALWQHWGQKVLKQTHILRIQFDFEMELIPLFYKMHYNIRPGLGLQCVIVYRCFFFIILICFFRLVFNMNKNALQPIGETVFFFFFFFFFFF